MKASGFLDVSLKDFPKPDFFSPIEIKSSDSLHGSELISNPGALNQWRYVMGSINQEILVKHN